MTVLQRIVRWLGMSDHTGARRGRDGGNLFGDRSGAIMVAGVFMAPLLAAGIFYIIATGDAIIYRERLQDAADAAAYTSAGVHARGMNLIVLINLIMLALMGVLIFFRLLMILLGLAIIGCAICIPFTIFCPLSAPCAAMMSTMVQTEIKLKNGTDKYEKVLSWVLPLLSGAEKVIAVATPWVGAYKGYKVGSYYNPVETSAWVVSPSMVPFYPTSPTTKIGLPVEDMKYDDFCKKAAEMGIKKGFGFLPDVIGKIFEWIAGGLAKEFSGYFCGNDKGGAADMIKKKMNDQINKGCEKQGDECVNKGNQMKWSGATQEDYDKVEKCTGVPGQDKEGCLSKYCDIAPNSVTVYEGSRCKSETKAEAEKKEKEMGGFDSTGGVQNGGLKWNKTPKDIWKGAQIGGFWFQVYAFAKGDAQWPRKNDRGLAIATKSGAMPNVQAAWGDWRLAQAEFYFDEKGKWSKLKDDCMFRMGWRARLRRFQLSGLNLAGTGIDFVTDKLGDFLLNKLGGMSFLKSKTEGSFILEALESSLKDEVKKLVTSSDWFGAGKGWANDKVDGWLLPSWEFVH